MRCTHGWRLAMKKTWFDRHFGKYTWVGWAICIIAALFYCYEYNLRISPSIISFQLRDHYNDLSLSSFGILSSLYYWAYTPMQAVVGVTTDRYGPRNCLIGAIILCVIGNYLFGASHSLYLAGFGRILVGMGSAFAFVGTLKLAAIWLPKRLFPLFSGLTMSMGMLSAIVGDYAMTWVNMKFGWQWLLHIGSILGIIIFVVFIFLVHEKTMPKVRKKKETSLGFMYKTFFNFLMTPKYILVGLIGCFLYLSLAGFADIWGIPYIKTIYPGEGFRAASINSMVFWGWFVGAPSISFVAAKFNLRVTPIRYGCFAAAVLFAILLAFPHLPIALFGFILFIFGICCSVENLCFVLARDFASLRYAATAIGVVNLIIMISGLVIQPIIAHVVDAVWSGTMQDGLRVYTMHDYRIGLIIIPVFLFIAGILTFFVKDDIKFTRPRKRKTAKKKSKK
jgi:MFS family permease